MPPTLPTDNPYLAARAEFTSVFLDQARARRNWQLCAFVLLASHALLLGAYIRLASQARITPYVVEVDRLGQALAFGPAERLRATDNRLVTYQLALFLRDLRLVSSDPDAQRELLFRAYSYVSGSARATLDAYFLDPGHDPRLLGRSLTRQVQVSSVLQIPRTHTWRVSWTETERPRFAGSLRTTSWDAYLRVEIVPPSTTETLLSNPLGLFVTELNWTQTSAQGAGPGDPRR